jgi:hypothetical protein
MREHVRAFAWAVPLLAAALGVAFPGAAAAGSVPACRVPTGELVAFKHGAALVTSNSTAKGSKTTVAYYGCLKGVGRIFLIDRGSSAGFSTVEPQNFVIAGDYLSFVHVSSSGPTGVSRMSIEQWNLKTGKRTLNPNTVAGVTYATFASPPRFTASTSGYLAWVITTGASSDPTSVGAVNTVTNLMLFDGHGATVAASFNSQTDTAPPGTILSGIFTNVAIKGRTLSWQRFGQPGSTPIG